MKTLPFIGVRMFSKFFKLLAPNREKLDTLYGKNTVEYYRTVFLSKLGRSFAAMLVVVHLTIMFPGTSFLDTQTKLWLAPFVTVLVGMLCCSAWLVERGKDISARYLTNFTISASTMISVILCGGFIDSHATPFLLAHIVVAFCISPREEAVVVGSITFFLPLVFDGLVALNGWQIPDYTSVSNPTANVIFLMVTLFVTVFMALTFLQKTNDELQAALDHDKQVLKHWATLDPLTEIGNRRAFDLTLETAYNEASLNNGRFALLFLDMNKFKAINDEFGHEVGDEVLVVIACRLHEIVRNTDNLARLGGDEFAILVREPFDNAYLEHLMEKIRELIKVPITISGVDHQVSMSIGKALYPDDTVNISELMRVADMDMYAVKMKDQLLSTHDELNQQKLA